MASRRGERRKLKNEWKSQFKKDDAVLSKIGKLSMSNYSFRSVPIAYPSEKETEAMESIWEAADSSSNVGELIRKYFATSSDHYWSLLKLLKSFHDHFLKSSEEKETRLARKKYFQMFRIIIQEFRKLEKSSLLEVELAATLCEEVRMAAFQLLGDLDAEFLLEDANSIFHFDAQPELYVGSVAHLVHRRNYRMAGHWVVMLDLHRHFQLTDIALPLLIESEIQLMENYLDGESENNRKSFLALCDRLCNEKKALEEITLKLNVKKVKITECRQLATVVSHLPGRYKISLEKCHHLKAWIKVFTVDHLVHSQYRNGTLDEEDWEYFLTEVTDDNLGFQMEALRLIAISKRDMGRAIKLAKKWKTPRLKIHPDINKAMQSHRDFAIQPFPQPKHKNNYYNPQLSNIIWVSKTLEYEQCINFISKSKTVSLKCECKRKFDVFGQGSIVMTSILQMATMERIYLLDVIALKSALSAKEWRKLIVKVFANSSICKLIFDFEEEWQSLTAVCPAAFRNATLNTKLFVDLKLLAETINDKEPTVIAFSKTNENVDLDSLLETCFNSSLNRLEEISNWEKRPMRETQLQYAAMGAFCLLEIYKYFEQQCCKKEIVFDELIETSQSKLRATVHN